MTVRNLNLSGVAEDHKVKEKFSLNLKFEEDNLVRDFS